MCINHIEKSRALHSFQITSLIITSNHRKCFSIYFQKRNGAIWKENEFSAHQNAKNEHQEKRGKTRNINPVIELNKDGGWGQWPMPKLKLDVKIWSLQTKIDTSLSYVARNNRETWIPLKEVIRIFMADLHPIFQNMCSIHDSRKQK